MNKFVAFIGLIFLSSAIGTMTKQPVGFAVFGAGLIILSTNRLFGTK